MSYRDLRRQGFTLIELLTVVAVVAIVLTLAAPSFKNFILTQRLKSINAQLVTDLQYARSEAVSRAVPVHVKVQAWTAASQMSCYIIYTTTTPITSSSPNAANDCNCTAAAGSRCLAHANEIRTVQLPTSLSVRVGIPSFLPIPVPSQASNFAFDPRTGGIQTGAFDFSAAHPNQFSVDAFIDVGRKLRDTVGFSGRVQVCIPAGSHLEGTAC